MYVDGFISVFLGRPLRLRSYDSPLLLIHTSPYCFVDRQYWAMRILVSDFHS